MMRRWFVPCRNIQFFHASLDSGLEIVADILQFIFWNLNMKNLFALEWNEIMITEIFEQMNNMTSFTWLLSLDSVLLLSSEALLMLNTDLQRSWSFSLCLKSLSKKSRISTLLFKSVSNILILSCLTSDIRKFEMLCKKLNKKHQIKDLLTILPCSFLSICTLFHCF